MMAKKNGENNTRELLAELKTCVKYVEKELAELNNFVEKQNDKLDKVIITQNEINKGFNNHLTIHETQRREMFTKMTLILSAISLVMSILINAFLR